MNAAADAAVEALTGARPGEKIAIMREGEMVEMRFHVVEARWGALVNVPDTVLAEDLIVVVWEPDEKKLSCWLDGPTLMKEPLTSWGTHEKGATRTLRSMRRMRDLEPRIIGPA